MILRPSHVPILILANLGLIPFVACNQEETRPVTIPTSSATVTTTASAPATMETASASASAAASESATPTAVATGSVAPSASALGKKECATSRDCGPAYMECVHVTPNAVGHCDYRHNYNLGRPLIVDGEAHVAGFASAPKISSTDVAALMAAASEEHASIAAFARTISELMALGAPSWLLFETQSALADEIRHTEMTLDLILRATGERPSLGRLPAAVAPLRSGDAAASDLFCDVFRGGAIGETLAAAHAEALAESADDDALREFYQTLFHDEARHAALAFKTLRWLLEQNPELARVLDEEKARLTGESFETRTLVFPLLDVIG